MLFFLCETELKHAKNLRTVELAVGPESHLSLSLVEKAYCLW